MKKLLTLSLVIYCSLSAFSQDNVWNLERCIRHAQENNLTIKQAVLRANASEVTYKQSKENLLPSVSANTGYSYAVGRYLNPYTNEFIADANNSLNLSLNANWVLFDGLRMISNIKKSKVDLMTNQASIEKVSRNISLEIALSYLNILRNEELYNASAAQLESINKQVERTEKLVQAGSLPQGSLLEVQAQQAQEQANVIDTQNAVELAKLALIQLLDLTDIANFQIEHPQLPDPSTQVLTVTIDEVAAKLDELPEMREASLMVESSEVTLSLARSQYSPSLYLSAGISTGYSDSRTQNTLTGNMRESAIGYLKPSNEIVYTQSPEFSTQKISLGNQLRDNRYDQISLSLSIPIYSRGEIRSSVSTAKISIEQAKLNYNQTKLSAFKTVQQALADAKAALAKYQSSKLSAEATAKAFEYTEQKFNVGAINAFEYNQSKTKLLQAQTTLAQSKYDFIFRLKIIDFYQGIEIKL